MLWSISWSWFHSHTSFVLSGFLSLMQGFLRIHTGGSNTYSYENISPDLWKLSYSFHTNLHNSIIFNRGMRLVLFVVTWSTIAYKGSKICALEFFLPLTEYERETVSLLYLKTWGYTVTYMMYFSVLYFWIIEYVSQKIHKEKTMWTRRNS